MSIEQGKRMSWINCLKEGKNLGILNYKNSESLRQQYSKYIKKGKFKEKNSDNVARDYVYTRVLYKDSSKTSRSILRNFCDVLKDQHKGK